VRVEPDRKSFEENRTDSSLEIAELCLRAEDHPCHDMALASFDDLDAETVFEGRFEWTVVHFNDFASMVNKLNIIDTLLPHFADLEQSRWDIWNVVGIGVREVKTDTVFPEFERGWRIIVTAKTLGSVTGGRIDMPLVRV
jgi:hypothetical protein